MGDRVHQSGTEAGHRNPWNGLSEIRFLVDGQDGDVRFPIENEEPFHEVLKAGPIAWLQQAEVAWTTWHRLTHQVLDVRPSETYKRAQGESAPSTIH